VAGYSPAYQIRQLEAAIGAPGHSRKRTGRSPGCQSIPGASVVLAIYTGQRRGDLVALPWSAYDGQRIRLTQGKTGAGLVIPCHPMLRAKLEQWRRDRNPAVMTILTDDRRMPWDAHRLSNNFPYALRALGLTGLNVHGHRKLAATNLAEAGGSTHEIAAITGHRTLSMIQLYTQAVSQERLASAAIERLSRHRDNQKLR